MITDEQIQNWFTYHAPNGLEQIAAHEFALTILANTPSSADQTTAIRKIREAVMMANAAIACGG